MTFCIHQVNHHANSW